MVAQQGAGEELAACPVGGGEWLRQIADEAVRQFAAQGYRCSLQEREVDGEAHMGEAVSKTGFIQRILGCVD